MVWVYCSCVKLPLFQTDLPPLLIRDAVARYVLGLRKLKGGRVYSGMKPLSHLVLHKCYFFSFSWDSRVCFALTHRSYLWSGWVIAVQSSEMVLERLCAEGGCLQSSSLQREGSIWEWGHPTAFLSPPRSSLWLQKLRKGTFHCCNDRICLQWHWQLKVDTLLSLCKI